VPRAKFFFAVVFFSVLVASPAIAQRRITGRVTDQASGQPVSGAAILVQGTPLGTSASDSGTFVLQVPEGPIVLTVRRIGYSRQDIPLSAAETSADVSLRRDVLQLETLVTTGAATSVAKRNAANDVASVSAEQMSRVSAPSLENALAGRIAGAQVSANSGAPGGGNQVRLRGVTSVFGSADPLYVVDGVIVSNEVIQPGLNAITAAARTAMGSNASNQDNGVNRIADLNPNDIESVEVLKGASASAIYGSKASNGVIIIKTKQGQTGTATGYPAVDVVQRFGTRGLARKYGARRFTIDEARQYGATIGMSQAEVDANYASCGGFCDFEDQLFGEHPFNYETSVSVRGGLSQTSYFASGLNSYDGGVQKNTGYRKQSVRLNLTQLIRPGLTLTVNNNIVRTLTSRGVSNNDNVNVTPYFVFATTPSWFDMRPAGGVYPVTPIAISNVFQDRDLIRSPEEVYRLISSASAAYSAFTSERQSLTFRLDGGVDRFNQQDNIVSPRILYFEPNDGLPGTVTSLSGNVLRANANLSAIHEFRPGGWSATTSAGLQREISQQRSTNIVTRDVLLGQENINRGAATEVYADRQEVRGLALFGQEELLGLDERLLATLGARAERSTVNGDVNKFYFFPKASLSFRMPGLLGIFDEFKPRVAFGQSGNQPLYIQKYTPGIFTTYTGQNAVQPGLILGNPTIRPERETELEGGIDASLWNQRASIALTFYQKTIKDLILHFVTAPSLGYQVDIRNGGTIRNRGAEMALALTPISSERFDWLSRMTFARNVGIVTSLPPGVTAFNVERDASGQRVAFGSGYGIGRLEVGKRVTQIIATDSVGGTVEEVQKGDAAPVFTMGFANDFTFGKLKLTSLIDWSHGGDLVNITMDVYDAFGLSPKLADGGLNRAKRNDQLGVSQYVFDASFVKLRELTLSYALPAGFTTRFFRGASSSRIEFSGRNLVTWSDYPGVDPEVSNFGSQQIARFIDLAPYPPSRSFYFTIALGY